jgi:hypothetical protein
MLLDDVFSELDAGRRTLLVRELAARGQSVITTADRRQLPGSSEHEISMIEIPTDVVGPVRPATCAPGNTSRAAARTLALSGSAA